MKRTTADYIRDEDTALNTALEALVSVYVFQLKEALQIQDHGSVNIKIVMHVVTQQTTSTNFEPKQRLIITESAMFTVQTQIAMVELGTIIMNE